MSDDQSQSDWSEAALTKAWGADLPPADDELHEAIPPQPVVYSLVVECTQGPNDHVRKELGYLGSTLWQKQAVNVSLTMWEPDQPEVDQDYVVAAEYPITDPSATDDVVS